MSARGSACATAALWMLALTGCAAGLPRPRVLGHVDDARESPAAQLSERQAPQAHAHAELLRKRAEAAYAAGDTATAQIAGEHALAAYEHAVVLGRLTVAEARQAEVTARLRHSEQELAALDEQQKRVLAETEGLELRARVVRDTLPLPVNTPATPERERARLDAARALALQARLLCASARLLDPARPSFPLLFGELDTLDGRLAKRALPAPIDDATRLRSRCLVELTQIRRPKTLSAPAAGLADELLTQLSSAGYEPVRDDRGVAVTLRGVFGPGAAPLEAAQKQLDALGRVAASHPDFPVLVVLHTARGAGGDRERQRLEAAAARVRAGGARRVEASFGADAAPAVDPGRPGAAERNERLEVVFVAPTAS